MLYVFTENDAVKQRCTSPPPRPPLSAMSTLPNLRTVIDETISGSIQFNGVVQHVAGTFPAVHFLSHTNHSYAQSTDRLTCNSAYF